MMKMILKLKIRKETFLFAVVAIMTFLAADVLAVDVLAAAGQGIDTSGPDSAYCSGMGYLYTTKPGVNNGQAVCQFPDGTWCDAHAFFTGDCAASTNIPYNPNINPYTYNPYAYNPYMYGNPYMYNNPQGALDIADATKTCQKYGGGVQSVHTSYGDVNMCVFPGDGYVDLMALRNGINGGFYGDNWYYYAYSWLNAP